jgi:hypothetical protein
MELLVAVRNVLLDTASSYPPLILYGNVFCAAVCYRLDPSKTGSGPLFAFLYSFAFMAYPGGLTSSIIAIGRAPPILTNPAVLQAHLVAFLAVNFSPFDSVFAVCKQRHVMMVLTFISKVDGYTSALGLMMLCRNSFTQGMVAGLLMHYGGTALSIARGENTFLSTVPNLCYYLLSLTAFYIFALRSCVPQADNAQFARECMQQSPWFEGLVVLGALRGTFVPVREALDGVIRLGFNSVQSLANALGLMYWPEAALKES